MMELSQNGMVSRYNTATRMAHQILIQQAQVDRQTIGEAMALRRTDRYLSTKSAPEFVYDTERMIEETITPQTIPLWFRLLCLSAGIGVITGLFIIVAIFIAGLSRPIL